MLLGNGDGTYITGPLDVWCILYNVETETYHPAFFEERPLPGPIVDFRKMKLVRLKSKFHSTIGKKTMEEAILELEENSKKIIVPEENVWREVFEWDGELGIVLMVNNWKREARAQRA